MLASWRGLTDGNTFPQAHKVARRALLVMRSEPHSRSVLQDLLIGGGTYAVTHVDTWGAAARMCEKGAYHALILEGEAEVDVEAARAMPPNIPVVAVVEGRRVTEDADGSLPRAHAYVALGELGSGILVRAIEFAQAQAETRHGRDGPGDDEFPGSHATRAAHGMNNHLAVILGSASLAQAGSPEGSALQRALTTICTAARTAGELSRAILTYGDRNVRVPAGGEVGEVIRGMEAMLTSAVPESTELTFTHSPSRLLVGPGPTLIRQVVLNLILQAAESVGSDLGVVCVDTDRLTEWSPSVEGAQGADGAPRVVREGALRHCARIRVRSSAVWPQGEPPDDNLGLNITESIVASFGGTVRTRALSAGGWSTSVCLPLRS